MKSTLDIVVEHAVREIKALNHNYPGDAHGEADYIVLDALRKLGAPQIAEEYERLVKRCGWWATE